MMTDNARANLRIHWVLRGGDTGMRGAEHRSFLQFGFTHQKRCKKIDSISAGKHSLTDK